MCGILLQYTTKPSEEKQQHFSSALRSLTHRGPDAQNSLFMSPFYIGHTRLSIIDLSTSNQPIQSPDKNHTLTYNGEIYNYKALRTQLSPRWSFKTHGDTEVLLAGLMLEGPAFLTKLNGMWAFAFVNHQENSVFLARDPIGKKPLYYTTLNNELALSSELPALKKILQSSPATNQSALSHYFQYGYTPTDKTIYQDIHKLPPGCYATWQPQAQIDIQPYWSPIESITPFQGTYDEAKDQLKIELEESVKKRLVSDVEVGCLLSGGVDSSIVACLAAKQSSKPLKTFCIGFDEKSYDESRHARIIANQIGSDHSEITLQDFDQERLTKLILQHIGEPFADISILPTFLAFQLASQHVKVVLSGDGADELFSGYRRYQARYVYDTLHLGNPLFRFTLNKLSALLGDTTKHHSGSIKRRLRLLANFCERTRQNHQQFAPEQFEKGIFQALFPHAELRPYPLNDFNTNPVSKMQFCDQTHYLPEDILLKVDRAAMANSVEPRAPFLDKSVIRFVNSLPIHYKQKLLHGKHILKDTYTNHFPKNFLARKKQGFAVPIGNWFKGRLGKKLLEMSQLDTHYVNSNSLQNLIKKHQTGQQDYGLQLWLIYCYFIWFEQERTQ